MSIKNSWMLEFSLLLLDLLVIVLIAVWLFGFRVNITPSLPKGIYQISSESIERDDLVAFCLGFDNPFSVLADERGYLGPGSCPSGLRPLLKRLVGLPGDQVVINADGISLNGNLLPGSGRPSHDSQGRRLPDSLLHEGAITVGVGLLLSQGHAGSFDSRHFGLIPLASLKKVKPIIVSGQKKIEPHNQQLHHNRRQTSN